MSVAVVLDALGSPAAASHLLDSHLFVTGLHETRTSPALQPCWVTMLEHRRRVPSEPGPVPVELPGLESRARETKVPWYLDPVTAEVTVARGKGADP